MNFKPLFKPKTMAVIGVSLTNDHHPANVIYFKNHLRNPVKVYPVNPRGGEMQRERVFKDISEIPTEIDLAVIAARSEYVPDILKKCIHANVKGAAIISVGFAETGRVELQDRLVAIATESKFPFIGPNCLGIYSPNYVDTFFLPSERLVRPNDGNVAIISQSGGVLVDQMVKFASQGVGISLAVSIGNKAMVDELDLLRYLVKDPTTKVIALYLEGFGKNEGREFVKAAGKSKKPVIVLKAGKSSEGSKAVSSHTASLAGNYEVFSQVLTQFGIAEAKNEFELLCFCESLSCYPQNIQGRVGIITVSGGHGVLSVDICASHGLAVPSLSRAIREDIRAKLSASIRSIAALGNPIDLTGSAQDDDFLTAVRRLSKTPDVDCILVLLLPYSPGITMDLGARLSRVCHKEGKPLVAYVPNVERYRMLIEGFELNNVPVASSIDGAVFMIEAMKRYKQC